MQSYPKSVPRIPFGSKERLAAPLASIGCDLCHGPYPDRKHRARRYCEDCLTISRESAVRKAAGAVNQALATGQLVRPPRCSSCGEVPRFGSRVHAHHESYAPEHRLDVVWLCPSCHKRRHIELRKESAR